MAIRKMYWFNGFVVILLIFFCRLGSCEVYTSVAEMKEVVQLEDQLIETVDKYIQSEKERLDTIERYLENYKEHNSKARDDIDSYLENPINAYLLIKRLVVDLEKIENLVGFNSSNSILANITSYKQNEKFPTTEDLIGSTVALTRLQDTYDMDTASVARGELLGVKYTPELTASDCFQIGKQCYDNEDYYFAQSWLQEADTRFDQENNQLLERSLILEHAALTAYKLGNFPLALIITNRLLGEFDSGRSRTPDSDPNNEWLDTYNNLCRGTLASSVDFSKLKCRYVNNNNPILLIAPFKSEEVAIYPKIVVFHDIISDNEIEVLKELSLPRFRRAEINYGSEGGITSPVRIGKIAWLLQRYHKTVADVNRRIGHMTGLTIENSEPLQVSNYGVGGHYHTHFDFSDEENSEIFARGFGNRIATALLYLSDVSQGGATVFPISRVIIEPRKGSAAFWYNLHASGYGDGRTAHGGCPVLVGEKWVANKWLYERGQEFRRPCEMTQYPTVLF